MEALPQQDQVFLLTQTIFSRMNRLLVRYFSPYGLTPQQATVLLALCKDGPCSVSALCRVCAMGKSNLSPLLNRLQDHGYLQKKRSDEDQRVVLVELTPLGREIIVSTAQQAQLQILPQALFSPSDREVILRGLTCFLNCLDRALCAPEHKE